METNEILSEEAVEPFIKKSHCSELAKRPSKLNISNCSRRQVIVTCVFVGFTLRLWGHCPNN